MANAYLAQADGGWITPTEGYALARESVTEEALAIVQQESDEGNRLTYLAVVLQVAGRQAEADEALKALIARWADTAAFYVAQTYAYRGDRDSAMQWLESAYKQKDVALGEIVGEPLFKSMADDPRYKAFLRKMKLPESAPPALGPKG
jgi:tetratricopeptide (TPR) repeat protein